MLRSRTAFTGLLVGLTLVPAAHSQTAAPAGTSSATGSVSATGTTAASSGTTPAAPATTPKAAAAPASNAGPSVVPGTAPRMKRVVPRPPAPTAQQMKAYRLLLDESREYERNAKDFRRTLTQIVRHHYEERRRRTLSALDREIKIEKQGLDQARNEAIARLENFIDRYSGTNADPEATPDAMFRLAALYEERGREKSESDIAVGLEPAIRLYRRIIKEYPGYEEIAAVHYYLGHAYTDAARLEEGQQAWRALVCNNRYTVKDDPKDQTRIELQPLPQDHDDKYWTDWYNRHPLPLDQAGVRGARGRAVAARPAGRGAAAEETNYVDPYEGCKPLPQETLPGEEPRYLAEVWWQLGNHHFDQIDPRGGPFNLNRAVTGYERSMEYKRPPIYGVSLYKLAWTYFKQQRYHTAVDWFVKLLFYADEQEAKTGDPGADFRAEAYTY
ncbi:MAG TPA: hypothetical protein VIM73_10335, partial [Polyangiaceae bacterium]